MINMDKMWKDYPKNKDAEKYHIKQVYEMAISSLDPENFNNIDKALRQLASNRNIEIEL
jgi:hypothetical protein